MKTNDLKEDALDWAVGKCMGWDVHVSQSGNVYVIAKLSGNIYDCKPSTDWAQGGPIIEREELALCICGVGWEASTFVDVNGETDAVIGYGTTPLIAAMRCYVASVIGDDVEIPEELK